MHVVIMAGGKGTRMAQMNADVPKPMLPLLGKPMLEYQLECLARQGFCSVTLVVGHLGHTVREYFGDGSGLSPATGQPFGVSIRYIEETEPLGTAGALYYLRDADEGVLLLNGDLIFDVDFERFIRCHQEKGAAATLFAHPNDHPGDSALLVTDDTGRVVRWLHKEDARGWARNLVNAGLHILSPGVLRRFEAPRKTDLDRDVLGPMIPAGGVYAYPSPEYVKDVGTPQRYTEVCRDIKAGRVAAKNLKKKQKAVFLDRDGTLNADVGFLTDIEDLRLVPGAAAAVRRVNQSGRLAILITNQPVIARGEVSLPQLAEIHAKLETLLGQEGAYLDDIFFCPHHPHKGYAGEVPEYKMDCDCRKPKPGMLLAAAEKYNIALNQSWMIGDKPKDAQAGLAAGCRAALVGGVPGEAAPPNVPVYPDVGEAVDAALKGNEP